MNKFVNNLMKKKMNNLIKKKMKKNLKKKKLKNKKKNAILLMNQLQILWVIIIMKKNQDLLKNKYFEK